MSTYIPLDIQVQIIERFPIKSLIRFRSLCKAWKSFIDCSEFIAGYSFRQTQPQHLMIRYYEVGYGEEKEVKYVSYVDDDDNTFPQQNFALTVPPLVQLTTTVNGSSHGLLCLTGYFGEPDDSCPNSRTLMAVLWNPIIRKSIAVVVPNVVDWPFDSAILFGVCPDTKDPKLVKVTYIDYYQKMKSIPCQVMVFTFSSGEWTASCSNLPRKSIQFEDGSQTVIGQFIYLLAYDRTDEDDEPYNLIMSFDLSTYEFRELDLPDSLRWSYASISRLRESLVLLEYIPNFTTDKQVCDVWMMELGDRKAFTKLFTIKAPDASVAWTLGFRKSGEPIIEMQDDVDVDLTSALVVYESCLEKIKDLGICGNDRSFSMNSYTESLLLLDHDDGLIVRC